MWKPGSLRKFVPFTRRRVVALQGNYARSVIWCRVAVGEPGGRLCWVWVRAMQEVSSHLLWGENVSSARGPARDLHILPYSDAPKTLLSVVRHRREGSKRRVSPKPFANPPCTSWIGRAGTDVRQPRSKEAPPRSWPRTIGSGAPGGTCWCGQPLEGSESRGWHRAAGTAVSGTEDVPEWQQTRDRRGFPEVSGRGSCRAGDALRPVGGLQKRWPADAKPPVTAVHSCGCR